MGVATSALTQEEIEHMQAVSKFSSKQIRRLYKRFKKLDRDGSGTISSDEFLNIPELAINPLIPRVLALFQNVNFRDFLRTLSVFSNEAELKDKMEFAFKIYDCDEDGFISQADLFKVLRMMVGSNLGDGELNDIVAQTIQEADSDGDGRLSFDEFRQVMDDPDFLPKMTICM